MCQTPSTVKDERTNGRTDIETRPFVCCVCQGRPSYRGTKRDDSYKFKGGGDKNSGSTNKYTEHCSALTLPDIRALLVILATLPVTTAEAERVFSKVERKATAARAHMTEDRL